MFRALFRFIGKLFGYILSWLDAVRRTLINLVFLLIVGVVIAFVLRPSEPFPDNSALVLRPVGSLVEQSRVSQPLDFVRTGGTMISQTTLHELLRAIEAARDDDRISALVIETDDLGQGGISKLSELRDAIANFRTSGKPVFARGERFDQGQYYLASAADEVHISPDGFVLIRGLARYSSYFGNALETLGIKVHVFRVGEYKSFSEPFTRSDMSAEDRENTRDLLTGLWGTFTDAIAVSRGIDPDTLEHYIMDFGGALAASGGDAARAAFEVGLIDRVTTPDQWNERLKERLGVDENGTGYRGVSVNRYLAALKSVQPSEGRIAVLVAQGSITDGSGTPGGVGGDSLSRMIRDAREDEGIRALVLRIDSPGGSAWASEQIRRELELTRLAGKPVIASMSSTAASGGYWIAAGADEIWAHPLTITGSIGIFAMFPEFAEPLERLGVTTDGVSTGPLAGAFDPRRPLEPLAAEAMQIGIEYGYRRFLQTVATARGMSVAEVELSARGRVWTGDAANKIGLVDELGGLKGAIAAAAEHAGLERYEVIWPEARLSPGAILMRRLSDLTGFAPPLPAKPTESALGGMLQALHREAEALLSWNDPQHLYVHCLCEGP